jgi:hypothetical protein
LVEAGFCVRCQTLTGRILTTTVVSLATTVDLGCPHIGVLGHGAVGRPGTVTLGVIFTSEAEEQIVEPGQRPSSVGLSGGNANRLIQFMLYD